jgi:hypothetical protein
MEDSRALWQEWADWSVEHFERVFGDGEKGDADFKLLEADADNDLAFILMAAVKK